MQKYNIEGNINFYDALYKSLDNDSDDENNLCQISGFPLETNSVTLECNHKFNYEPLYKEICRQKYEFKTYHDSMLTKQDRKKVEVSQLDYFIKCPYCRNIQFSILPYYEELKLKPKYGINSLDPNLQPKNNKFTNITYHNEDKDTFIFKSGQCSFITNTLSNKLCTVKYVTQYKNNTDISFCKTHYKMGVELLKQKQKEEKQKQKEEKQKQKEEKQKQKEEKQKLLDEKNTERLANGLLPLKRLPIVKKKLQNIVQEAQQIGQYVPEGEDEQKIQSIEQTIIGCKSILKTGPNKGSYCGCKKIYEDGLCNRHSLHNNEKPIKNDL